MRIVRLCKEPQCTNKHYGLDRCENHYKKWKRQQGLGGESSESRRSYVNKWNRTEKGHWSALQRAARVTGIPSDITIEHYKELRQQPCDYCGAPLNPTGHGLDKKDPAKGYVRGNVVPCCVTCNRMKNTFLTHEEMKFVMQQLKLFRSHTYKD